MGLLTFWLLTASCLTFAMSANEEFLAPRNANCACLGDVLTYTCTAVGGGSTLWGGTAFDCTSTMNEIILRHSQYIGGGTFGECNDGAIVGRSLGVDELCYTSRLTVTVGDSLLNDVNNMTIQCTHNSNAGADTVGGGSLTVVSAPYPPPHDIHVIDVRPGQITFAWTSVSPDCSSIHYVISSTDCGSCLDVTNVTTVSCSNLNLPSVCTFSVQSMVCNYTGSASDPTTVMLKFPGAPRVDTIPHYSNDNQTLIKLTAIDNQTITDPILSISNYSVSYFDSISGVILDSKVLPTSCTDGVCELVVDVSSYCSLSARHINITVSAVNRLGEGPPLEHIIIGCKPTDRFVEVEVKHETTNTSTVTCIFQNHLDTTEKSCSIRYGQCNKNLSQNAEATSTAESPNNISLKLSLEVADQMYCYAVKATNGTFTVIVEGHIDRMNVSSGGHDNRTSIIIIAGSVVLISFILIVAVLVVIVSFYCTTKPGHTVVELEEEHKLGQCSVD